MERLEEDGVDDLVVCCVLLILLDVRLDREADGETNAKPDADGANRQRSAATVDFIIVVRRR